MTSATRPQPISHLGPATDPVRDGTTAHPNPQGPVDPVAGASRPLGDESVRILGGFWGERQAVNATVTLRHCLTWLERSGWLANFDRVAGRTTAGVTRPGWPFSDSEVYKLMEALAWEYGRGGDGWCADQLSFLTARVARAQAADGYLNTAFGHAGQAPRYSDLEDGHELYCTGHLLQAGVAVMRAVGRTHPLVEVARRAADEVLANFGRDRAEGPGLCGHAEIEVALVEFARATGDERYRDQARLFVARRGHGTLAPSRLGRSYSQDDVPVREATVWSGHAVRALYLAAGATDIAVDDGDLDFLHTLERQWAQTVARRMHLTGGMGSRHQDEGFGEDWELPPDRAYCETCAGVGSVMVARRLYLATGRIQYADLVERTLFNVVAASPSRAGDAFFYANPLQERTVDHHQSDPMSLRAESVSREPWFDVSCCPTNVARTFASLASLVADTDDAGLTITFFAPCQIRTATPDGRRISVQVDTAFPYDGRVTVTIQDSEPRPWTLRLRVPDWAENALLVDGSGESVVGPGLVEVTRVFTRGESIELVMPMHPQLVAPDPRIDALRGCVAVQRGPEVFCLESTDLPDGVDVVDVDLVGLGPVSADARAIEVTLDQRHRDQHGWPYVPVARTPDGAVAGSAEPQRLDAVLRPYHDRAERGPATMRVWMPAAAT